MVDKVLQGLASNLINKYKNKSYKTHMYSYVKESRKQRNVNISQEGGILDDFLGFSKFSILPVIFRQPEKYVLLFK